MVDIDFVFIAIDLLQPHIILVSCNLISLSRERYGILYWWVFEANIELCFMHRLFFILQTEPIYWLFLNRIYQLSIDGAWGYCRTVLYQYYIIVSVYFVKPLRLSWCTAIAFIQLLTCSIQCFVPKGERCGMYVSIISHLMDPKYKATEMPVNPIKTLKLKRTDPSALLLSPWIKMDPKNTIMALMHHNSL